MGRGHPPCSERYPPSRSWGVVLGRENHRFWRYRVADLESWAWLFMNGSLMGMLRHTFITSVWYCWGLLAAGMWLTERGSASQSKPLHGSGPLLDPLAPTE
jgi:hypothetical protein